MGRLRNPKRNLRLRLSANSRVRVAVDSGLEAANRFDLAGQSLVAEKPALLRERNPERMLLRASRCTGSTVILSARSQSAAFSHGST